MRKTMRCYAECCRVFGHRLNSDKFERKPLLQWSNSRRGDQKRQISGGQQTDPKIQRHKMKHEKQEKEERSLNGKWRLEVARWKGCLSARTMLSSLSTSSAMYASDLYIYTPSLYVCVSVCAATNKKRWKNLQLQFLTSAPFSQWTERRPGNNQAHVLPLFVPHVLVVAAAAAGPHCCCCCCCRAF